MSDSGDEVIPDSQAPLDDVSMGSPSPPASQPAPPPSDTAGASASAPPKRTFSYITREDESQESFGEPTTAMDEHLTCAICQEIMHNPFYIEPCAHSYCRSCLEQWWQNKPDCPQCKVRSNTAKHNFTLEAIINQHRIDTKRVSRRRKLDDIAREPLFPRGRRAFVSLPSTMQTQTQSQDGGGFGGLLLNSIPLIDSGGISLMGSASQSQPVVPPLPDAAGPFGGGGGPFYPGGNLLFPCPSCPPGNPTGYLCPLDARIPMPTAGQIAAEQNENRPNGPPVREPLRGERRVGLASARRDGRPGASTHEVCDGCKAYIPSGWNPEQQVCADCDMHLCSNYDRQGCPSRQRLRHRAHLGGGDVTSRSLWNGLPMHLRNNGDEFSRFETYLTSTGTTVDNVLERIVQAKLDKAKQDARAQFPAGDAAEEEFEDDIREAYAELDRKWGPSAWLCDAFVGNVKAGLLDWWIAERRRRAPDGTATLQDCWYGYQCRTQSNPIHPTHSQRFNHICVNTAPPPGQQGQNAAPLGGGGGGGGRGSGVLSGLVGNLLGFQVQRDG